MKKATMILSKDFVIGQTNRTFIWFLCGAYGQCGI